MITDETQTWLSRVFDWAWARGIGYTSSSLFAPDSVCKAVPSNRLIIVNTNYHDQQQLPFQAAHEVGHIMSCDLAPVAFTTSKIGREGRANRFAINLLVPWFYDEIDQSAANSRWFLKSFHLPDSMGDWVDEAVLNYYSRPGY